MTDFDFSKLARDESSLFHYGVHETNYKNGAFKNEIAASKDMLDTIKIFTDSPLTTEWEKHMFRAAGRVIFDARHNHAGDTQGGRSRVLEVLMALNTVFERDQIERGIDVPPLIAQTFDRQGNVAKTTTCDTYGNVTAMPGGPDLLGGIKAHAAAEDKKNRAKADTAKWVPRSRGQRRCLPQPVSLS